MAIKKTIEARLELKAARYPQPDRSTAGAMLPHPPDGALLYSVGGTVVALAQGDDLVVLDAVQLRAIADAAPEILADLAP